MKKRILIITILMAVVVCLGGCECGGQKQVDYLNYVSELRSNVYKGESQDYKIKASYGYREIPYANDGKVGKKAEILSFELEKVENLEISYYICFSHGEQNYEKEFKLNHHQSALICEIEVKDFKSDSFKVKVGTLGEKQEIEMKSVIPKGSLDSKGAIDSLVKNQPSLLESYKNESGEFNGEIYARVLEKEGKAYWYIGIANGEGNLKALLIDGTNGEILAVREVF